MKERFVNALKRFISYRDSINRRNKLLEEVLCTDKGETQIFDFIGIQELFDCTVDLAIVSFKNLKVKSIKEDIEWYLYEAVDMKEPTIEVNGDVYIINSPEDFADYLFEQNIFQLNNVIGGLYTNCAR